MSRLLEIAQTYVKHGFSVIPLMPKGKRPMFAWAEYQTRLATEEELELWFGGYRPLTETEKDLWWRKAKEPKEPPSEQRLRQMFGNGNGNSNNIGIVTGKVSNLTVLDCDSQAAIDLARSKGVGDGPRVITAKGGHFYYLFHAGSRNWQSRKDTLPGIDLRSEGGFVVAPPSNHPDGPKYRWENSQADRIELPGWLVPEPPKLAQLPSSAPARREATVTLTQKVKRASAYLAKVPGAVSGSGGHQKTWEAALSIVRGFALPSGVAFDLLKTEYNQRCQPAWTDKEIQHKIADAAENSRLQFGYLLDKEPIRSTPQRDYASAVDGSSAIQAEPDTTKEYEYTDVGNAHRFRDCHGNDLRYLHKRKKWYRWSQSLWVECEIGEPDVLASQLSLQIRKDAENTADQDKHAAINKFAMRTQSSGAIRSVLEVARSMHPIPVVEGSFDSDGFLLATENLTLELLSGKAREHRREDLITKKAAVVYDPEAKCPKFIEFMDNIFNNQEMSSNQETIDYLQEVFGHCLTGDIGQQSMWIFFGVGANGKNTLLNIIMWILGKYAVTAPPNFLIAKQNDPHPTEQAWPMGARLVMAEESDEGSKLSEGLVKRLTGGSEITARHMFGDFFQFKPTAKLFFLTNSKPEIRGQDRGIWRRIKPIEFKKEIPRSEWIDGLDRKLYDEESSGILNWMLAGLKRYLDRGNKFIEPAELTASLATYKAEMDIIGAFLNEMCVFAVDAKTSKSNLYRIYSKWCADNGTFCYSSHKFFIKLNYKAREHGTSVRDSKETGELLGLYLKSEETRI